MNIYLTGYSGFVGKHISEYLNTKYNVIHINLREIINKENLFNNLSNDDWIINCAASLRPKTDNDKYINSELPVFLMNYIKKKGVNVRLIHLSSINTLKDELKDNYTLSKKKAEQKLTEKNVTIIRLPLIIKLNEEKVIENYGQISIFFKYLKIPILFYPMIFPGNIYTPLDIKKLLNFTNEIIEGKKNNKIYNLLGKDKVNTFEIFKKIATNQNKKVIKINFEIFIKFLPNGIKKFIYKYNFLYNIFANINFEDIKEEKEYL